MKKLLFLLLISATLVTSCGKNSGGGTDASEVMEQQQDLTGNYKAFLRPLNTSVSGFIPYGAAEIKVLDGEITVKTYLDDDSRVTHIQSIYSGSKCPARSDDKNKDGFIDVVELEASSGRAIVPLDSDLSGQQNGFGSYPKGSSFTYTESTKLEDMVSDLYDSNESIVDGFMKLKTGTPFNLENRVVLVFGTGEIGRVPESVATFKDQPRNFSVPIACGILKRL